eukprot:INCI1851.1.p1 GENE.INCI1851.1~~INCI1851.1.p1  ORF type:complete len:588 (-),score=85.56 INCI1851.1:107-1789(-)
MPTLRTLCGLSAAAAAAAAAAVSPGAAAAGSGPPGHIVFRDVNILAVTDVHSWIAGGDRQVPQGTPPLDATFGDLTSLKERAQEAAAKEGKDVFLFDNGDVIDGTGLSNVAEDHCEYLLPLLQRVPFDALNCGNHELYSNSTMEAFASSGYIDYWNGTYVTSNLRNATTGAHLGSTHTILTGPVSGVRLLVFGFMYEMSTDEGRCEAVAIDGVTNTTQEPWFTLAIQNRSAYDAVVVLAHMDCYDHFIDEIVAGIRVHQPDVPVQVIAGHSHARRQRLIGNNTAVFEPGNYFNTVGYASFDIPSETEKVEMPPTSFFLTDLDAAVHSMAAYVGTTAQKLPTLNGSAVAEAIADERARLGLSNVLGCSDSDYLEGPDLYRLYVDDIVPKGLFSPPGNTSQWFVQSTGSLRYDVYKGNVTVDDIYKVLPFRDSLYLVRGVSGSNLTKLLSMLNGADVEVPAPLEVLAHWTPRRPRFGVEHGNPLDNGAYISTNDAPSGFMSYDAFFVHFDAPVIAEYLGQISGAPVSVESVTQGPATDTDLMLNWANTSLPKRCSNSSARSW